VRAALARQSRFIRQEIRGERENATGIPFGTNAIAARAKVTPESLLQEAEEARQGAMENKQFGAAATVIKVKSVLSGHWIERQEVGPPGAFDALTDDELERVLIERLKALGLTPDGERTRDTESDTRH
jgi:hypothetical protein